MCIRDAQGLPVAAISVSTLASRLQGERVDEVVVFLREAVSTIEQELRRLRASV